MNRDGMRRVHLITVVLSLEGVQLLCGLAYDDGGMGTATSRNPDDVSCSHCLVAMGQSKHLATARERFHEALMIRPHTPETLRTLANRAHALANWMEAKS